MPILSISSPNYKSNFKYIPSFASKNVKNDVDVSKQNLRLNFFKENIECIKSNFDENIGPFISDSRVLYNEVGTIGYNAQLVLNKVNKSNEELSRAQRMALIGFEDSCSVDFGKYFDRFAKYEENVRAFKRHEEFALKPIYENPELTKKINDAKKYFLKNEIIDEIRPIHEKYVQGRNSVFDLFGQVSLQKFAPDIFEKLKDIKDIHSSASYFMLVTPYQQAIKLRDEIANISKELANPKDNLMKTYFRIGKLDEQVYTLNNSKNTFYENQDKMKQFVDKYKKSKYQMIDVATIENAYKNIEYNVLTNSRNQHLQVKKAVNNSSLKALSEDALKELDVLIEKQASLNNEIFGMINEIKTSYIMKQNEEFYKKHHII